MPRADPVLLKDIFEFTLEETAAVLCTTIGAIEAALHRGRGKLAEREPVERGQAPRVERREYHDEPVLVCWYDHDDGPVVRDILRVGIEGDRVVSIRYHFFSPDVLADVCGELGVPWRSNGYRYWPIDK